MAKRKTAKQVKDKASDSAPDKVLAPGVKDRRVEFARQYALDRNAKAAYIRAGYKDGPSAYACASRLLADPDVAAAIAALEQAATTSTIASVQRLEEELQRLALADLRKLYRPDGSLKPPHEWDDDTAAAVGGLEVAEEVASKRKKSKDGDEEKEERTTSSYTKKVKCWDKRAALVDLLKRRDAANKPPEAAPGSAPDRPIYVEHNHNVSPVAIRSFLGDIRRAGLVGTGVADVPAHGDGQPVDSQGALAKPDRG